MIFVYLCLIFVLFYFRPDIGAKAHFEEYDFPLDLKIVIGFATYVLNCRPTQVLVSFYWTI